LSAVDPQVVIRSERNVDTAIAIGLYIVITLEENLSIL